MKKSFFETIFGIILLVFLVYLAGDLLGFLVNEFFISGLKINENILDILQSYFIQLIPLSFYIFVMKVSKKNNFMLKKFSFKNNKLLLGLILGFIINSLCVLIAVLNNNLSLSLNNINIGIFIFAFICVFIQCLEEEVLCRLFMYEKIKENYSVKIAVIVNTIFFALLHIGNPGMTIISFISLLAFGLLASLFIFYFDDIWGAAAVHLGWNFTQNIIFGLPNSGFSSPYSLFKVVKSSNSLFYDVDFGIEGTIVSVIVMILACFFLYCLGKKKMSNKKIKAK